MKRRNMMKTVLAAILVCAGAAYAENTTTAPADAPAPAPAPAVKGNAKSKVYHKPACRHYNAKKTTVEFKTEAEAVKAGFKPCKKCAVPKKEKPAKEKKAEEKTEAPAATE